MALALVNIGGVDMVEQTGLQSMREKVDGDKQQVLQRPARKVDGAKQQVLQGPAGTVTALSNCIRRWLRYSEAGAWRHGSSKGGNARS